jgi:hypothetical protein
VWNWLLMLLIMITSAQRPVYRVVVATDPVYITL